MLQICPKCSYVRQAADQGDPGECPACGLIIANYLATTAKRDAAKVGRRPPPEAVRRGWSPVVKFMLLLVVIAGAVNLYLNHHSNAGKIKLVNLPKLADASKTSDKYEFIDLFNGDTSLANLAMPGHYTVVEVYLDDCPYCRELELALATFQERRKDVEVVRVHHPGHMDSSVQATSREELTEKLNALKTKMASYQLCGAPHVEVFGPNREAINVDTCKSRGGTDFLWDWIASETGIVRRSAAGAVSTMM